MANAKPKNRNLKSTFMLVFVLVLSLMVVIEMSINIINEVGDQNRATTTEVSPGTGIGNSAEPTPTLFEVLPLE
jgi:1,4-dihydroxy-2-naphthoate octaprenyltransferase